MSKCFALGIVMVLTSPRAYNFNCAPQSSQYLYTIALIIYIFIRVFSISNTICSKMRMIGKTTCETQREANATGVVQAFNVKQASA